MSKLVSQINKEKIIQKLSEFSVQKFTPTRQQLSLHFRSVGSVYVGQVSELTKLHLYLDKLISHANFLNIVFEGQIVGSVAYYVNHPSQMAFISNFSISKHLSRHGLGSILMRCLVKELISIGSIRFLQLEVNYNNQRAMKFYLRQGFLLEGRKGLKVSMKKRVRI